MAFSALSLSTTTGVQGRPYRAVLSGLQATSTIEMGGDGSPGFSYVNGRFSSQALPYPVSTLVFYELRPGEGRKEWRFDISAVGAPVQSVAADGTITYTGAGGGAPTAQAANAQASGPVFTITRLLGSSSTLALVSGTNANLTLNATTGVISATATIGAGVSQTAQVSETNGSLRIDYPVVITGVAVGAALAISGTLTAATVGDTGAFTPAISGGTPSYTLSLLSGTLPAGRAISGLSVTGTYTTAGSYSYTLRATDSVGATVDLAVGPVVVAAVGAGTPATINAVSRPPSVTFTRAANYMGDSTGLGTGAPAGSEPWQQWRALIAAGPTAQPFHLLGGTTLVTADKVGNGGVGGENSAQVLTRVQNVATNYPGELPRIWRLGAGLNDYLPSVTPQTRQWANNVKANWGTAVALIPGTGDYFFGLAPQEQNSVGGMQWGADHVFHRRDMRATYGSRAIDVARSLRFIRQREGVLAGGADEKALSNGAIPYSYRGTGVYSPISAGTDYADGDRTPLIQSVAPSNTTDLAYDDGTLWYHNNGSSPVMYRKTGANGAGGWAASDLKHFGRVGYGKIAQIDMDIASAMEGVGPPYAAPYEMRCPIDAAPGATIGTVSIIGTPSVAGLYDYSGNLSTLFTISTTGVITRTATGTLTDGVTELVLALTRNIGGTDRTLHSPVDIYITRASGSVPAIRTIASPGVNINSRANHGLVNTTAFSLAMYLRVDTLASGPTLMIENRNSNLASSPTSPPTPINITLTAGGQPRVTVTDTTNTVIANSLIASGASFTAGTAAWMFLAIDFAGNVRLIYNNDTAGTLGAVTSGIVPMSDGLFNFLMGAGPNQYYDGVSPLVGGIGYIGLWDGFVDWSVAANRRMLLKADGTPEARTPYAAIGGLAPKLEIFGSKGNFLDGTPDGSNGPQTLSISHRARTLMG
jgi:hypothetical protein